MRKCVVWNKMRCDETLKQYTEWDVCLYKSMCEKNKNTKQKHEIKHSNHLVRKKHKNTHQMFIKTYVTNTFMFQITTNNMRCMRLISWDVWITKN